MSIAFKKAERSKVKLKIGISGPSGSGKTYSALRLASGMGKKIAVLDSEKGSASLYSDRFNFDVIEINPPYSVEKYLHVIELAAKEKYDVLIIDSVSHAWAGEGGLLNEKEKMDQRGGNSFANWAKMTPKQEKFISGIVHSDIHIICTMRSKQDYSQDKENGKIKIQKVGLAPVQREGFEYEMTTVFDVAMNHECETSKDRTGLFVDKIFQITEKTGEAFISWLSKCEREVVSIAPLETQKVIDETIIETQKIKDQLEREQKLYIWEQIIKYRSDMSTKALYEFLFKKTYAKKSDVPLSELHELFAKVKEHGVVKDE